MSFEENFLYPLYLLLIGGGMSGIAIPTYNEMIKRRQKALDEIKHQHQIDIDRKREDHRNEMEIKSQITKKVAEAHAIVGFQIYDISKKILEKTKAESSVEKLFGEWYKETGIVTSLIDAYFRNSNIRTDWANFNNNLAHVWMLFDRVKQGIKLSNNNLEEMKKYFKDKINVDLDELQKGENIAQGYNEFNTVLNELKNGMIRQILDEEIDTGKNS